MRESLTHAKTFFYLLRKNITSLEDAELDEAHQLLNEAVRQNPTLGTVPYPPTSKTCDPILRNHCALCFGGLYDSIHQ